MSFDFQHRTNKIIRNCRIFGCWCDDNLLSFYTIYAILLHISYNLHNLAQWAHMIDHYDDLNEWTSGGLLTLSEFLSNQKAYSIIRNKNLILKFRDLVTEEAFQPRNERQASVIKSIFRLFDVMYLLHIVGPTMVCLLFGIYPLVEGGEERLLSFEALYPYDSKRSPMYELTLVHQFFSAVSAAHIQVHADLMFMNVIAMLISQMEILRQDLEEIRTEEGLLQCIHHHRVILTCFREVYEMLSPSLFGQYIMSTTAICLTTFQLSKNSVDTQFFALLVYGLALTMQLFLFCWWANELTIKSLSLSDAVFQNEFYKQSRKFQRNLLFLMQKAQTPMTLCAAGFFKVSLGSFMIILKNSYSCFAVLRQKNV